MGATGDLGEGPENPGAKNLDKKRSKLADSVQGLQLWKRVRRVVSLDINIRAPGPLSTLLAEMRAGKGLSPTSWSMYEERILKSPDPRLTDINSPFSQYEWRFIVHRHKIRVHRSMVNAKAATAGQKTLYIVQASDVAVRAEDNGKMPHVREELLRRVSPRDTQSLPGILPLYIGMRLTYQNKDGEREGANVDITKTLLSRKTAN